jgi:hypothetical protein
LLDYLAVEFMERSWDFKWLHRLIVTSRTYKLQSATPGAGDATATANAKIDPDNRLLWRANLRRMEAEAVRDALLHVSGRLDTSMGGPEIDQSQGEAVLRRSIYLRHAHEKQMEFLKLFDAANINECYQRNESLIPQQALAVANSGLSLEGSRVLAKRLSGDAASSVGDADFIFAAFEQVLCRPPTDEERKECEKFLADQAQRLSEPKSLAAFGGKGRGVSPSSDPRQRARENLVHVLFNHNDFVTIR